MYIVFEGMNKNKQKENIMYKLSATWKSFPIQYFDTKRKAIAALRKAVRETGKKRIGSDAIYLDDLSAPEGNQLLGQYDEYGLDLYLD